mgnify:FL=1
MAKSTKSFAVNELGEIVATSGVGSSNIVGYLPSDYVSTDNDGRLVLAMQGNEDAIFASLLASNGAKLDGVTDDSGAFQSSINALSTLTSGRISVSLPTGKTIKLNSGLTFDIGKVYLDGKNCKLDFSGMSSGTAITLTGTAYDKTFGGVMGGLAHLHIVGPSTTGNVDGVLFTGDTNPDMTSPFGSARSVLQHCVVEKFKFGVTFWHRAYLATLEHCEVYRNRVGIYSKAGGVDAYENVALMRGAVFNNHVNIYIEEGHVTCFGTSIDYAEYVQMAMRAGSLILNKCHVEYSISNQNYGQAGGIYATNAPLCAIDLDAGGVASGLSATIGLTYTTASTNKNYTFFQMDGGNWVVGAPRHTSNGIVTHVSVVDNVVADFKGKIRMSHQVNVPTSGYLGGKLSAYNAYDTTNYAGCLDFDPACWPDDLPHIAHRGGSGPYMSTNPLVGYSISPAHNLASGFQLASGSFEAANLLEDVCITGDTAAITDRQTGTNGSFVRSGADGSFNGGTGSFKITKVGAAATAFKLAFLFPRNSAIQRRPVIRMACAKPATGGATTGSFNVNMKFIKPEYVTLASGETIWREVHGAVLHPGGAATSGSGTTSINPTVYKSTGGSAYCDVSALTAGTWYPLQIAENIDRSVPAWATHVMLEFDLTNLGAGTLIMDGLDIQWM